MRNLQVGDVVGVTVNVFGFPIFHVGLVTQVGWNGVRVISNSKKNGKVVEESLEAFASGGRVVPHRTLRPRNRAAAVAWARRKAGKPWSVWDNCEHFVSEACQQGRSSPQLVKGLALGGLALLAVVGTATTAAASSAGRR